MRLTLRYAADSDVGLVREGNEDSGYAGPHLLAVADGMGGHAAGEVASSVVIATLAPLDEDAPRHDLLDALAGAIRSANTHLHDMVLGDDELEGMGTTLTAVLRSGSRLGLAHVGDSRAYLLRDGTLSQITRDHTFVQSLVDEGRITPEEADHHPQRALVTRALDGRLNVDIDLSIREARPGDRYLLCSDGLSGVVSADTLRDTLAQGDPAQAVAALVDLALRGGGPDNITCIVADVVDVDATPDAVPVAVGAVGGEGQDRSRGRDEHAAGRAASLASAPERAEKSTIDRTQPASPRRSWVRAGLLVGLVVLLVAALGAAAWAWTRNQYFVGPRADRVAIYQGLPQRVAGLDLAKVYEVQTVPLADLPAFDRERVQQSISARDLDDARTIVARLEEQARLCRAAAATPAPTLAPTPESTAAPSPGTGEPAPTATAAASPLPTATAPPTGAPTAAPTAPPERPSGCGEETP